MRRVLAVALGALLAAASGAAAASSYTRPTPINAGGYTVSGVGAAAEYTRTVPYQYRTSAQRTVAMAIGDALVMGKPNIAKNARLLLRATPAALALTAAATGIQLLLNDALLQMQNGEVQRIAQQGNGTCTTGNPATPVPNVSETLCQARVRSYMASIGRTYSHIQIANNPNGSITFVYRDTLGGSGGSMNFANAAARDVVVPGGPASDADIEAAVNAAGNTDARLSETMKWLAAANHPLTLDGSEKASLSGATQESSPYGVSSTTRPDGSLVTTSSVDRVSVEPVGNNGPAAANRADFVEVKITVVTSPDGDTTTEQIIIGPGDPVPEQEPEPCGAPGQAACATQEVGTFDSPSFIIPGVPAAPTFSASLERLGQGLAAAPIASIAAAVAVPTGAACPVYSGTFEIVGTLTFDTHCVIAENIRPVLTGVCILIYGLWGIRRVMSA